MPRRKAPIDENLTGAVVEFARLLRRVRESAGDPSYDEMRRVAYYSKATLSTADKGHKLPSKEVMLGYLRGCQASPEQINMCVGAWEAAQEQLATPTIAQVSQSGTDPPNPAALPAPRAGLTVAALLADLRQVLEWVGSPSYQTISQRAAAQGLSLPRSTIGDMFTKGRLPKLPTMMAFLQACGVPASYQQDLARVHELTAMMDPSAALSYGPVIGMSPAPPSTPAASLAGSDALERLPLPMPTKLIIAGPGVPAGGDIPKVTMRSKPWPILAPANETAETFCPPPTEAEWPPDTDADAPTEPEPLPGSRPQTVSRADAAPATPSPAGPARPKNPQPVIGVIDPPPHHRQKMWPTGVIDSPPPPDQSETQPSWEIWQPASWRDQPHTTRTFDQQPSSDYEWPPDEILGPPTEVERAGPRLSSAVPGVKRLRVIRNRTAHPAKRGRKSLKPPR